MSSPSSELTHQIVRAGAGAGKTTDLVQRISESAMAFHAEHERWPQIVVTTFTRKATQELRERLVLFALDQENSELLSYVTSPSKVFISTIHGVLRKFLTMHGSVIGIVPNFQLVDDREDINERKRILKSVLADTPSTQRFLYEESVHRLLQLLDNYYELKFSHPDLHPFQEKALKASLDKEVASVRQRMQWIVDGIRGETDHVKWNQFADALARAAAVDGTETLDAWSDFRKQEKKPNNSGKVKPLPEGLSDDVKALWSDLKTLIERPDVNPSYYAQVAARAEEFAELANRWLIDYFKAKVKSARLRQSDLELLSAELIRQAPQSAQQFAQEWDYWFIDEFQDTSPIQVHLFDHLIQDRPVYIVGDPQQSIYLFRGARSEIFSEKWRQFEQRSFETRVKMKNWRSKPPLMEFINDLVTGVSHQFERMTPRGEIEKSEPVAEVHALGTLDEEIEAVGNHIAKLINAGAEPGDIAVLTRKRAQIRQIAIHLSERQIPYQTFVPAGFFDRLEIIDALNLLKFICQPHDDETLVGLLRSPWFRMPDKDIGRYAQAKAKSLWSTLSEVENSSTTLLKRVIENSEVIGIGAAWQQALMSSGLIDTCLFHDLSGRREANIWKLVTQLRGLEGRPGFRYLEFVAKSMESIGAKEAEEEGEAVAAFEPNRVHLMTTHKSKGLQFEHVVVPFAGEPGQLTKTHQLIFDESTQGFCCDLPDEQLGRSKPIIADQVRAELNDREKSENERVLYVALTRAKSTLFLSWSRVRTHSWASLLMPVIQGLRIKETPYTFEYINESQPEVEFAGSATELSPLRELFQSESREMTRVAITELTSGQKGRRQVSIDNLKKTQTGVMIHRLFENLRHHSVEDLKSIINGWANADLAQSSLDFVASVDEIPLLSLIKNGFVEWGFSFRHEDLALDGQIDLWGVDGDVTYIVDYKTGSRRHRDKAFEQLQYYAFCLHLGGKVSTSQLQLVVIYPGDEKIYRMSINPEDAVRAIEERAQESN